MSEPQPASEIHEHEWRLVSTDTDGTVVVKEFICLGCPAVLIEE